MNGRVLTAIAILAIFVSAGVAAGLMFPGHESGARVAIFGGLFCTLAGPVFARAMSRSRERRR